jgi:hypothetical protein
MEDIAKNRKIVTFQKAWSAISKFANAIPLHFTTEFLVVSSFIIFDKIEKKEFKYFNSRKKTKTWRNLFIKWRVHGNPQMCDSRWSWINLYLWWESLLEWERSTMWSEKNLLSLQLNINNLNTLLIRNQVKIQRNLH